MLVLASVNPELFFVAATDKHHFKYKFMSLKKVNALIPRLMYVTSDGQEVLFLVPLATHPQVTVSLTGEVLSATPSCLCFLNLL